MHREGARALLQAFTVTLESPHGATPATLSSRPPAVRSRALSSLHEHFGILALSQALGSCPHPSLVYVCGALAQVPRPGPRSKCMQTGFAPGLLAPPPVSMFHYVPFFAVSGVIFQY